MQLLRKVVKIGNSEGIVIPQVWLESVRRQTGRQEVIVTLDINGSIIITPVLEAPKPKGT